MTHLGQLPFYVIYINGPNFGCPRGQYEYIHYTLVFDTRYLKNTGINIGSRTGRLCSSRQDPKTEDRTGRVGRAEADRQ